jgi:hypothetical protein
MLSNKRHKKENAKLVLLFQLQTVFTFFIVAVALELVLLKCSGLPLALPFQVKEMLFKQSIQHNRNFN